MKVQPFHKRSSAFSKLIGIDTLPGGRACRLIIRSRHANAMGNAHGGAIFTLADRAFSCCVNAKGRTAVAMEMKINYLSPVVIGDVLTARARMLKKGRSTTVCCVEVMRKKELVAVVLATGFNMG
jgi:acyl-CoA thioesterase